MAEQWRGVEGVQATKGFERVCRVHRQVIVDGKRDEMLCPMGHVVPEDDFAVVEAGKVGRLGVQSFRKGDVMESQSSRSEMRTGGGTVTAAHGGMQLRKGSKKVFESQGFNSLGGHSMWLSLELGGRIAPYVVRIKRKNEKGAVDTGVLDMATAPGEAKKAYEDRIQRAMDKGWRLGLQRSSRGLTDIPDAPDEPAEPIDPVATEPRRKVGRPRARA